MNERKKVLPFSSGKKIIISQESNLVRFKITRNSRTEQKLVALKNN